jgi:hypothetical protein
VGDAVSNLERLKRLLDIRAIRTCREEYYRNLGALRLTIKKALIARLVMSLAAS